MTLYVTAWRWLSGSTSRAHLLRVATALLLLIFGSVDQLRYYLALRADDLQVRASEVHDLSIYPVG